jgi:hypothetical protein
MKLGIMGPWMARESWANRAIETANAWCQNRAKAGADVEVSCHDRYKPDVYAASYCLFDPDASPSVRGVIGLIPTEIDKPVNKCGLQSQRYGAVIMHELLLHVVGCLDEDRDVKEQLLLRVAACLDKLSLPSRGKCSTYRGLRTPVK